MPCSAMTNKTKLKSALDNFDKILDEYEKLPEKPKLKKAKTCSIIESKCILKKSLSIENTADGKGTSRGGGLEEETRCKSKSLYDINSEEALILASLTPVVKTTPAKRPVHPNLSNSKVRGVVNRLNCQQSAVRPPGATKSAEKNVCAKPVSTVKLNKQHTFRKDALTRKTPLPRASGNDAHGPMDDTSRKSAKVKTVQAPPAQLKANFDVAERKVQLLNKFNQNGSLTPSVSLKRDTSLRQTDRDVPEVVATSNQTIARSLIPKARSCHDVSQQVADGKKPFRSSKIPVKHATLASQTAFPSTPSGLHLLVDRCSEVPSTKGQSIFTVSHRTRTFEEKYPRPPQATPRMSLFGVRKHQVESKYVENLPKARAKVHRSATYTKTVPHLEIKTAHAHQLLETKYHRASDLAVEVPVSKSAVTLTERVVETVVDLQTDEKGYASDDSGNISNDLDVDEGAAGLKYSSAESLSSTGGPGEKKVLTYSLTVSKCLVPRTSKVPGLVL